MAISAKDVMKLREMTDAPMMECKSALESAGGDLDKAVKVLRERGIAKMAKRADRETTEGTVRIKIGPKNRGGAAVMVTCETDFSARNDAFQNLADAALEAAMGGGAGATPDTVLDTVIGGRAVRATLEDVANTIRENMTVKQVVRYEGVCGAYVHFDGKSGALLEVEGGNDSAELATLLRDVCMHVVAFQPAPLAVDAGGIPQAFIDAEKEIFIKRAVESGKPKEIAEKMVAGQMKKLIAERALLEQPFVKNPDQTVAAFLAAGAKSLGLATLQVKRFARLQIGG